VIKVEEVEAELIKLFEGWKTDNKNKEPVQQVGSVELPPGSITLFDEEEVGTSMCCSILAM
jgi:hypothetical protein